MSTKCTILFEIREFALFTPREQRYIKMSLDILADGGNYDGVFLRWSRDLKESRKIIERQQAYADLARLRDKVKEGFDATDIETISGILISLSNFDLKQGYISSFTHIAFFMSVFWAQK